MKLTDEKILELAIDGGIYDCVCDPYDKDGAGDQYSSIRHDFVRFARAILKAAGVEELEQDAERYRWLCRQTYGCEPEPFRLLDDFDSDKQSIDAAIDEAMKAK